MMRTLSLLAALALTTAGLNAQTKPNDAWDLYKTNAQSLQRLTKAADFQDISATSSTLTYLAKSMLPEFAASHPQCNEYLSAVVKAADTMQTLTLEQIESDYHADGKLPKVQSAKCYHAKDLLVHPATVTVMAKTLTDTDETRKNMAHEIVEVIMHFDQVANLK
ncbi:hypothetical protein [Algibacillus agarilyticus]|uniref:hypothetical protein n=1 Tax=Algibacillus agarilyticus TaxID=2234133 RepID=UPI000DCFEF96|nr:hypothetical protein [Algibacillus agarilyticus]